MNSQETPTASSSRTEKGAAVNVPPEGATTGGRGNQPDDIDNALVEAMEPTVGGKLQILKDIDLEGDYKAPILAPAVEASLPSDPAFIDSSVLCQAPPPRMSLESSIDLGIITAQRSPHPAVKDIKIGQELLVVNTSFMTIKPDQTDAFYSNQAPGVDALYEARFREFGLPLKENAAELSLEANSGKGPDHVPSSVSEGRVATISMVVDKTGAPNFVPSMELRRSNAGEGAPEGAGVLANLEQTSPPQKRLTVENVNPESLSQGSSSSDSSI